MHRSYEKKSFELLITFFLKAIILLVCGFVLFFVSTFKNIQLCVLFLFSVNILLVFCNRKNRYTFFLSLFIFWFNYSIFYANYFSNIQSSFFDDAYTDYGLYGFKIVLCFTCLLSIFTPLCRKDKTEREIKIFDYNGSSNNVLIIIYLILLAVIMIVGFGRPTEQGERGTPTPLYEYSTILFIVGYYFLGKNKLYRIISSIILLLYCFQNLFFGGRITALQLLLILFFFFYDSRKINWTIVLICGVVGMVIFSSIGEFRANFRLNISFLQSATQAIKKDMGTLDTAYSAYYTSLTFLKVKTVTSVSDRLLLFWEFIKSIFLGGSVPNSSLAQVTMQYYQHYEGGVLPFFGYFYLGPMGLVLFSALIAWYLCIIKKIKSDSSGFKKCFVVYITITTPRWYLYSPSQLLRGVLLLLIVFVGMKYACKFLTKR